MAIAKLRDLAKYGIITDQDPYDLPLGAWSAGVNVRFSDGRIQQAPVFRNAFTPTNTDPRFITARLAPGFDELFVAHRSGKVTRIVNGTETDYSIAGYTPSNNDAVWNSTKLAEVLYVNREDRVPWALTPSGSAFVPLANWTSTWRARLVRAYAGVLVALNVSKAGVVGRTTVNTSSVADAGLVPASWDYTTLSSGATQNILSEMRGEIVEAQPLKDTLVIYSQKETVMMQATGDASLPYVYRTLFTDAGAINVNCAVEVDGRHYVFGINDIWMHDGISKRSIASGRVKRFIFSSLATNKYQTCFVSYHPTLKEVLFCYVSADRMAGFLGGAGANRAASYSIDDDKWTFYDLPYVFAATESALSNSPTWGTASGSWAAAGGSWADLEDGFKKGIFFVGEPNTAHGLTQRVYAHDLYGTGSIFTFPVNTNAMLGSQLERDGIDLDDVNEELRGYKVISSVYPQGRCASGSTIDFSFGAGDTFNVPASGFSAFQTYDGVTNYKCDYRNAGRFLSMKMRYNDYRDMSLSGLDLDLIVTGRR
jgi:hypothetical protein